MSSYIENNEANLLTRKHTLCVFYDMLKRLSAKLFVEGLFNRLFRVVAFRFFFGRFLLYKTTLWPAGTHSFKDSGPELARWSKTSKFRKTR